MESLEQDVDNCLIFLIANQHKWMPKRTIDRKYQPGHNLITVPTLLVGITDKKEVVAPGHISIKQPAKGTKE